MNKKMSLFFSACAFLICVPHSKGSNPPPKTCILTQSPIKLGSYDPSNTAKAKLDRHASLFGQITNNDGKVLLWSLVHPKEAFISIEPDLSIGQSYVGLSFSSNSTYVALDSSLANTGIRTRGRLDIVNTLTRKIIHRLDTYIWGGEGLSKFAFSAKEERLLAYVPDDGSQGKTVVISDLNSGKKIARIKYDFCTIDTLAFHPGGSQIAIKDVCGNAVRIYDINSANILTTLVPDLALPDDYEASSKGLIFWGNGTMLATHSTRSYYALSWNISSRQSTFETSWMDSLPILASESTQNLAMEDIFGEINILNVRNPNTTLILTPFGTFNFASSAAFSPSDRYFATASGGGELVLYDGIQFTTLCNGTLLNGDEIDQIVFSEEDVFLTLTSSYDLTKWTISS